MKQERFGRILRGQCDEDFSCLSDDRERRLVMLMGEDGLQKIEGLTDHQKLVEIGYTDEYIERKIREGCQFKLVVFDRSVVAKLATWINVKKMVKLAYPEMPYRYLYAIDLLPQVSLVEIENRLGFAFADVDVIGESDERFMTLPRLLAAPASIARMRAWLYFSCHLKELFSGDGYTYTNDGRRGMKEYLALNVPLRLIRGHQLLDLHP